MLTYKRALSLAGSEHALMAGCRIHRVPTELYGHHLPARVYGHEAFLCPFLRVLAGRRELIRSWGGCFEVRKVRGGRAISMHSAGLAADLNHHVWPLGRPVVLYREDFDALVEAMAVEGIDNGGGWTRPDPMHFQASELLFREWLASPEKFSSF